MDRSQSKSSGRESPNSSTDVLGTHLHAAVKEPPDGIGPTATTVYINLRNAEHRGDGGRSRLASHDVHSPVAIDLPGILEDGGEMRQDVLFHSSRRKAQQRLASFER